MYLSLCVYLPLSIQGYFWHTNTWAPDRRQRAHTHVLSNNTLSLPLFLSLAYVPVASFSLPSFSCCCCCCCCVAWRHTCSTWRRAANMIDPVTCVLTQGAHSGRPLIKQKIAINWDFCNVHSLIKAKAAIEQQQITAQQKKTGHYFEADKRPWLSLYIYLAIAVYQLLRCNCE